MLSLPSLFSKARLTLREKVSAALLSGCSDNDVDHVLNDILRQENASGLTDAILNRAVANKLSIIHNLQCQQTLASVLLNALAFEMFTAFLDRFPENQATILKGLFQRQECYVSKHGKNYAKLHLAYQFLLENAAASFSANEFAETVLLPAIQACRVASHWLVGREVHLEVAAEVQHALDFWLLKSSAQPFSVRNRHHFFDAAFGISAEKSVAFQLLQMHPMSRLDLTAPEDRLQLQTYLQRRIVFTEAELSNLELLFCDEHLRAQTGLQEALDSGQICLVGLDHALLQSAFRHGFSELWQFLLHDSGQFVRLSEDVLAKQISPEYLETLLERMHRYSAITFEDKKLLLPNDARQTPEEASAHRIQWFDKLAATRTQNPALAVGFKEYLPKHVQDLVFFLQFIETLDPKLFPMLTADFLERVAVALFSETQLIFSEAGEEHLLSAAVFGNRDQLARIHEKLDVGDNRLIDDQQALSATFCRLRQYSTDGETFRLALSSEAARQALRFGFIDSPEALTKCLEAPESKATAPKMRF